MNQSNLLAAAKSLFDYLWQGELASREPYGDPENGPSPDDFREPSSAKAVWKCAYSGARKEAQGMFAFNPHPKEIEHCAF